MAEKQEESLWRSILESSSRQSETLETKNLLLLGDRNCGKTTLLQRLQRGQDDILSKGVALDYSYLNVQDDQSDDVLGRIHVWQLEGETQHTDLLSFALNSSNIESTVAVICLDFSEPWRLEEQLERWLEVLSLHLESLRLNSALSKSCKSANEKRFLGYVEPSADHIPRQKASFLAIGTKKEEERGEEESEEFVGEEKGGVEAEIPPGVLDSVLAVPVVVVCCKADLIDSQLAQTYHITDDTVDFIQQHLRKICIKYGASLVYCSAGKDLNCDLLRAYLEHVLYGFDFTHTAQVSDRPTIFVPAGWDSLDKIQLEFEAQRACTDASTPFSDVVTCPSRQEGASIDNEEVEDFQEFLEKHKSTIEKIDLVKGTSSPAPAAVSIASAIDTTPKKKKEPTTPITPTTRPSAGTPSASPSVDNPEAIQNFFQNLLGASPSK